MSRATPLACLLLLVAGNSRAIDETDAVAKKNLHFVVDALDFGERNERIEAIHKLEFMQEDGVLGLAIAAEDGDWQVRMTAVHALGGAGRWGTPVLERVKRYETCPVVRLVAMHYLSDPDAGDEEAKELAWISQASTKDINRCQEHPEPGKAAWARKRRRITQKGDWENTPQVRASRAAPDKTAPRPATARQTAPPAEPEAQESHETVVTRDPVLGPRRAPAKPPEALPAPVKLERRTELDSLLDESTAAVSRRGVVLEMTGRSTAAPENLPRPATYAVREHEISAPGRFAGVSKEALKPAAPAAPPAKSTAAPESLPGPVTYAVRQHEDAAPGAIVKDAGAGKEAHDALPGLMSALKLGDSRTRARAADDLGHLGATAAPAVPELMKALRDASPRVRSSAGLALGNIGAADKGVEPLLLKALNDKNEDVRHSAALALERIRRGKGGKAP